MSKDKYPSIFSLQMEGIVFIIPQIFFATRAVVKIWEIYKQQSPFGAKICYDIFPRSLSVPRSEQFSESVTRGKL